MCVFNTVALALSLGPNEKTDYHKAILIKDTKPTWAHKLVCSLVPVSGTQAQHEYEMLTFYG